MAVAVRPRRTRRPPPSAGPHFAEFLATHCYHTKGRWAGTPVVFEPWQHRDWNLALELDPKTKKRVFKFVIFGRPRKNYKTTECAGLTLYLAGPDGEQGPEIACAAGSKDQADIVFGQARSFVQRSPALRSYFKPQMTVILVPTKFGVIRRISSDGGLQMGMNLSGAVIDELHVFTGQKHRELWAALNTSDVLREEPLIATITTAGYDKATLLGEIYDRTMQLPNVTVSADKSRTVVQDRENGFLMVWYGAPEDADIEDPKVWRAANPAETVPMEYLRRQLHSPHISEGEFRRLHLNQWTASQERWINDSVLYEANDPNLLIPGGARICCAVDAAIVHDTLAVSWSWRNESGRVIERKRVWSARQDVPYDVFVPGGRIDLELASDFIVEELASRYQLAEVAYDPTFWEGEASRLAKRGVRVAPFPKSGLLMTSALQGFYVDVQEGRVAWGGTEEWNKLDDPKVWLAHFQAAAAVQTDRGWKVSKIKSTRPIDAAIATVMSHARAVDTSLESVYEHRDLRVLGSADEHDDEEDEEWS